MQDEQPVTDQSEKPATNKTGPSLDAQSEPGRTDVTFSVPEEIASQGNDTNVPRSDSPESLDQEISEGADRERIDPDHSIVRPKLDTIDKVENGVN